MTSDEKILHLVDRINKINSGEDKVDRDTKCMLTIAFLRAWLEKSGKEVNEGVLFTLFNGIGTSFFGEGLKFEVSDKKIDLLNGEEKKYSFGSKVNDNLMTCNFKNKMSNGYLMADFSRDDGICSLGLVEKKDHIKIFSKFDRDGIEQSRSSMVTIIDKFFRNSGYEQKISCSRVGGSLFEKKVDMLPYGVLCSAMQEYSKNQDLFVEVEKIVDFVMVPNLKNVGSDFSLISGRFATFFRGSITDTFYPDLGSDIDFLGGYLDEEEDNVQFKKYFPKLSEAAERRIKEIIANGLVDEENKSTGVHR